MKKSAQSVRSFGDVRDYLRHVQQHYPGAHRPLSLAQWAKKLGYRSPRVLGMVLNGQRAPSPELVRKLTRDLRLNPSEAQHLTLLVEKRRLDGAGRSSETVAADLQRSRVKTHERAVLGTDEWAQLADWYALVIKQLAGTPDFREDARWIASKIRGQVTEDQVSRALSQLTAAGLLTRGTDGRLKPTGLGIFSSPEISQSAVRKHQSQMIQLAQASIDRQPLANREICTLTLQFDKRDLPEAKAMIRQFRDSFDDRFFTAEGRAIYQLNLQLIEHRRD